MGLRQNPLELTLFDWEARRLWHRNRGSSAKRLRIGEIRRLEQPSVTADFLEKIEIPAHDYRNRLVFDGLVGVEFLDQSQVGRDPSSED